MIKALAVAAALIALLIAPIALRVPPEAASGHDALIIISPHDLQTRSEFTAAFSKWAAEHLHTSVAIDWRTPGGTGEIMRYVGLQYHRSFQGRHADLARQDGWERFDDAGLDQADARAGKPPPAGALEARAAFLAADDPAAGASCGVDIWWGGGTVFHKKAADKGYLVDAGLLQDEPSWFSPAVMPQSLSGEAIYDPKGRFFGASLSVFGICASLDRIHALGVAVPEAWSDIGDARYLDTLGIVDPSRSAASAAAFERLIQQQMLMRWTAAPDAQAARDAALDDGWLEAFTLIKRIGANARDVSDGASLAVREVAHGDAAATMCIDFQARYEAEYAREASGVERLVFHAPVGGTSVSADPIALLRGAPHRAIAVAFIRFVLSPAGQRLWNYRVGEPGGPERFALRRLPVRHDAYTAADRAHMSDPDLDPYEVAAKFVYHPAWTAPYLDVIDWLVRALVLDPKPELTAAWRAIVAAGGPERVPRAWAEFKRLAVAYDQVKAAGTAIAKSPAERLAIMRRWTTEAQAQYRRARSLAEAGQ